MGKVKRIDNLAFNEARLGYIATLTDNGCSDVTVLREAGLNGLSQLHPMLDEITARDRAASLAEAEEETAICLYNVYRHNCLKQPITMWKDCKEHVRDRWRAIARKAFVVVPEVAARIAED